MPVGLIIKTFLKRITLLIILYTVCRILFYTFNQSAFKKAGLSEFFIGIRFDVSAIFIINLPIFIISSIPFKFIENKKFRIVVSTLFVLLNSLALALNLADIAYFPFNNKRSTAEIFKIAGSVNDFWKLLPNYLIDFWYLFLIFFVFIFMLFYSEKKLYTETSDTPRPYWQKWALFTGILILSIIGARGGIQYIPLHIMHASKYTNAANTALVLNTPFTIIKSIGIETIEPYTFFNENDLNKIIQVEHHYSFKEDFLPLNVLIIIMESFSKEYIGALSGNKSYTPFLDSLIKESYVFNNAFANAQKSMDGIPAVLSGIPLMMDNSYITSPYSTNTTKEIAHLLKDEGYTTLFFHGGKTGTMGFDAYAKSAGFDFYYGKENFKGKAEDDDGHWGIFDEPFFKFTAFELSKIKPPFFSVLFSLSSHHPYSVPKELEHQFSGGPLPIHKSVQYADYALKKFFEDASKLPWFNNTLFVITADHTSLAEEGFYRNSIGMFQIPIIYYAPNLKLKGWDTSTTQQIDIFPSILFLLKYPKPFFAFGKNAFDKSIYQYAVNYYNGIYQLNDDSLHLQFNGEEFIGMYRYKEDSLLQNNLIKTEKVPEKPGNTLKAFIQNFQHRMINNRLTLPAQ